MNTNMQDYIVKSEKIEWIPLKEEGIDTTGIYIKVLRYDEQQQRPPSFLLKFEAGATYPYHNHPGGEEIFVLKGTCTVNDCQLFGGDYLYTPPGFKHSVKTETGCEMMLIVPDEVEILGK